MGIKLDSLMADLNKKAKEEIISKGISTFKEYAKIPFTSPRMNYCTFGGLPVGKLIEFYGEEHGGKTTSALDIVANFQALERKHAEDDSSYVERSVLYCDCENSLDEEWARKLGVDVDSVYLLQPKTQSAEEIFDLILSVISTGECGLFVIDSIGAMISKQAYEKSVEERTYGGISLALTNFSAKAEMLCAKFKCTGIGINQIRDDLNSSWGGYKTPGGRAWKHLCMCRFQFSRGKFFDDKYSELSRGADSPVGNFVNLSITKIKSAPPTRRTGFYTLRYDTGIDYLYDLIEVAIKLEVIIKSGAWFDLVDEDGDSIKKVQGEAAMYSYLAENEAERQFVEERVNLLIG